MDNPDSEFKYNEDFIDCCRYCWGGLNSGLFTCEANTLPLSYNPYSSNINICEERVFYGCKKTNLYCLLIPIATDLNNKLPTWSCGGLNSGLFACKANTLPLSYNPYYCINMDNPDSEFKFNEDFIDCCRYCWGGLNSGLFTCEANTLPLSYNPYSSNINICEERVFYGCKNN
ncbi:hypothetical protein OUZ56_009730 [Daphnia magna]|uniref:Uncharacterized protein n=1 Tax=Daphnia magna TaxID=35525 RepID=A0ABR0AGU4_9CRUS|nr:hypothetical protein OUZ56_009730 [Daphnia magna]